MFIFKVVAASFYNNFVVGLSLDEDVKRREFIFNVLALSAMVLISAGLILTIVDKAQDGHAYNGTPPLTFVAALIIMAVLYIGNRHKFRVVSSYIFLSLFLLLATHGLYQYGYVLPQGILVYMLVIIMASILLSVRAALIMTALITISLLMLAYLHHNSITQFDMTDHNEPLTVSNLIVYLFLFSIVLLVSSLSNIEIKRSLTRARYSEEALRKERNLLERKVKERTEELEHAQVEKTLELYRFAEFGRMSSTLLHDIADPLTAVSLNLELLENRKKSKFVREVREGITHLEEYVYSARRQLRNQSEEKIFDSKIEIERVRKLLLPKARNQRVTIRTKLDHEALLYGDSSRFNQIIANLIANALDAYAGTTKKGAKLVQITSSRNAEDSVVIIVHDNGIGIPENELSRIFEPFFTTKASERGTGIGLTIIKRIIEEDFNGLINVESTKNKGTTFTVTLPLRQVV